MSESAMVRLDRSIEVAAGVFAPGHLGELTQFLPFELVDAVLADTGAVQQRVRVLPARVGVYFVLASCLFRQVSCVGVFAKLCAGLPGRLRTRPSEKALRDLRRRLGAAPFKALFEAVAGPLARPNTPGVSYRGWRTVAFDGCCSLTTPDSVRNRGWLGKIRYWQGWSGYPHLMLMVLCETGTRGLLGAVFGPADIDERDWARRLLPLLDARMLVLADRGFDADDFAAEVAGTGAQFLIRATAARNPPVLARLSDGSFLSRLGALPVRIIDVDVVVTLTDGTRNAERYRLITTLTDARTDPASALVRLYHERWEVETVLHGLRQGLLGGRHLRSQDRLGIEQEKWALLCLHQLLRCAMVNATDSVKGADPDRASFTSAVQAAREQVVLAAGTMPTIGTDGRLDLVGEIGRAIQASLNPPRRLRISARKVKSGRSRYASLPPGEWRPTASTPITGIAIAIHQPHHRPCRPPPESRTQTAPPAATK